MSLLKSWSWTAMTMVLLMHWNQLSPAVEGMVAKDLRRLLSLEDWLVTRRLTSSSPELELLLM
jgi:hypothetical protein